MTDKQQPDAFCWATELAMVRDPVTLTVKEAREVSDEMQRMHAENETLHVKLKVYEDLGDAGSDVQLLRMGYAAARLEIESLKAQSVGAQQPGAAGLIGALEDAQRAINSMKVEAETAAQGDEQMMLEACETISNEGFQADMAIRAALASHGQAPAGAAPAVAPSVTLASGLSLHPRTADLVQRFMAALAEKLARAEKKYGYRDNWASPDCVDGCQADLREHLRKGDPRDVAAYCAFLWHHGAVTTMPWERPVYGPTPSPQAAPAAVAGPNWNAIRAVQVQYAGIVKAAVGLLAAVDDRHDSDSPIKYTIPYGAVNALRDALTAAPTTQPAPQPTQTWPIAPDVAADLERSDWTPEEALRWYAAGKHYDTVPNGDGSSSARILDNGAVASNALKSMSREYAEHKGDVALQEPAPAARGGALDAVRLWGAFVEAWRNELGVDKIVNIMGGAEKLKAVFLDAARAAQEGKSHDN